MSYQFLKDLFQAILVHLISSFSILIKPFLRYLKHSKVNILAIVSSINYWSSFNL